MKNCILASVALAAFGASGVSEAQNSVTLYGVIDTGLSYVHNFPVGKRL
jgi:predicted porin